MGTTVEKLNKILETKEAIRTAINNKGGTLTESDTFSSYSSAIDSLPSGGGGSLKTLLDATQSTYYLFNNYKGTSVDGLISFSDTANVTNMQYMFSFCSNLTTIPLLDTSSVTSMEQMFYRCSNLTTIPLLDTSSVTSMYEMFYYCSNLTTISLLDTSSVNNMNSMFSFCSNLTTIPLLDTSSVTSMEQMFYRCSNLTTIPALDASKCTNFDSIFWGCTSLASIGMHGFTRSIYISETALDHDALVAFLNQAGTAYNSSQKITMGSKKLALLSDEEKAIAMNKGWTLA